MNKIKVTQEQANWLDRYVTDEGIDYAINIQVYRKRPDSPIADWDTSKVARALYVGYEVESDIEVGDYVVNEKGTVGIVKEIGGNGNRFMGRWLTGSQMSMDCSSDNIKRHATNEEVLFAKNGRYIWELSSGDILKDRETGKIHEVISESYIGTLLTCHTSPLNLDEIKRRYKLVCFSENRTDLKGDLYA